MEGSALNREEIAGLIDSDSPLVEGYLDLSMQLQPNGFDLSVMQVSRFTSLGILGSSNADRVLPETEEVAFHSDGWLNLPTGAFLVTFNEVVNLPLGIMALGRPRSSLLRSGVSLHTGVWDAGYHGRSQSLLTVHHPMGFRMQRNARLAQMVFFRLGEPAQAGYEGQYQGEGL